MWISVLFPKCGLTCGGESVKLWKVKKENAMMKTSTYPIVLTESCRLLQGSENVGMEFLSERLC